MGKLYRFFAGKSEDTRALVVLLDKIISLGF